MIGLVLFVFMNVKSNLTKLTLGDSFEQTAVYPTKKVANKDAGKV